VNLSHLSTSSKLALTLFSLIILIGLVVSSFYVNFSLDTSPLFSLPSVEYIRLKYSSPPLKRALLTSMKKFITSDAERQIVISWLDRGGYRSGYYESVEPILQLRCVPCHGQGTTRANVSLRNWGDLAPLALGHGMSRESLVAQTHYHLFGIGVIILFSALLFSRLSVSEKLKASVISLSFLALIVDISSWWLARRYDVAVYAILAAGITMIFMVVLMNISALWAMWNSFGKKQKRGEVRLKVVNSK